jgi:bifunctional DNase/RNase
MIPVKVDQLFFSNMGFVVLLKGTNDERSLPIFIGAAEAQAIAIQINKVTVPRPMTHDLLKKVLDYVEYRLKRIEVTELKQGTFYARLILERDGSEQHMDSRPSDAIALALRFAAPVLVAETVMDEAGRVFPELELGQPGSTVHNENSTEEQKDEHKELTPLEALKKELEKAVREERYETAAQLRDEIQRLKDSQSPN